jgi:hypothetical protein
MTVAFDLPASIEESLRRSVGDINVAAKEAALADLYRRHLLSEHQLAEALGLHRLELDGWLKERGIYLDITWEEVMREADSIRTILK